ncbi:MAG TPA: hypothetical protein VK358_08050, partial [Longimicrobium sp.]|nr:hypothetical protein [Longimicrobium sp.]
MSRRAYQSTVIGCALSWFLVGLHVPALHAITHHGRSPHWSVLSMVALLALGALAGLAVLLRAPAR